MTITKHIVYQLKEKLEYVCLCLLLCSTLASYSQIPKSILNTYGAIDSIVTDAVQKDVGILPAPTFNPSFGSGIAFVPFVIFKLPGTSVETHPSTVQALLMVNTLGSIITGVKSTTYLSKNKFWIDAYAGYMNVKLKPTESVSIGDQKYTSLYFEGFSSNLSVLYNLGSNLFLGPIINANYLNEFASDETEKVDTDHHWYITPGVKFSYDTRKDIYYPRDAWFGVATFQSLANRVDNQDVFQKMTLGMSNYIPISEKYNLVYANSIYSQIGFGNLPLHEKAAPGSSSILRGYTSGSYMDNSIITLQTELRWMFAERWGVVGFAGAGYLFDQLINLESGLFLPSIGTGLRWKMFKRLNINAALDVAWGKDRPNVYFRLSEAF